MKDHSSTKSESRKPPGKSLEKKLQDDEERYAARIRNGRINVNRMKLVVVGDGACGKVSARISFAPPTRSYRIIQTYLLYAFAKGRFPEVRGRLIVTFSR